MSFATERRPFAEIHQIQIIIVWRMNLKILLRKELKKNKKEDVIKIFNEVLVRYDNENSI